MVTGIIKISVIFIFGEIAGKRAIAEAVIR